MKPQKQHRKGGKASVEFPVFQRTSESRPHILHQLQIPRGLAPDRTGPLEREVPNLEALRREDHRVARLEVFEECTGGTEGVVAALAGGEDGDTLRVVDEELGEELEACVRGAR